MKAFKALFLLAICMAATSALGQAWATAYEAGLKAAKSGNWTEARTDFLKAAAYRPEDVSGPTLLPGPVTERRTWRSGAPYSPNFLAAYSGYKAAMAMAPGEDQSAMLKTVAGEFEERLAKGQASRATYYFLTAIYSKLGDVAKRDQTVQAFSAAGEKANWKVDADGITPEDLGEISSNSGATAGAPSGGNSIATTVKPDPTTGAVVPASTGLASVVVSVPTKYALIIGNSESRLGEALAYAGEDAQALKQGLVANAGYLDANVDVVLNGTSEQILTSAKALATRMPDGGTLTFFFAGRAVNVNGRDFLAGVDTASAADTTAMVSKSDVLDPFVRKGARIFCFFEVSRTVQDGRYFGMELPIQGEISQLFGTAQGSTVSSIYREGRPRGVFVDAFINVLQALKSNQIPIMEFGWQVFDKMRRGNTGGAGGGSQQIPTLPVLSHMAADARF